MTKTIPTELYFAEDGSDSKMNRVQENGMFLTYSILSCEEFQNLRDLLFDKCVKRKGKSKEIGSTGDQAIEPTANFGARTDTDTNGGDYLQ
jgi:hypothetical protein